MANQPTNINSANAHRYYATVAAQIDLLTANPRYDATDPTTHRLPRQIWVHGAGNLILRYEGRAADDDTIPITAAMCPWVREISPRYIQATSTVTVIEIYW